MDVGPYAYAPPPPSHAPALSRHPIPSLLSLMFPIASYPVRISPVKLLSGVVTLIIPWLFSFSCTHPGPTIRCSLFPHLSSKSHNRILHSSISLRYDTYLTKNSIFVHPCHIQEPTPSHGFCPWRRTSRLLYWTHMMQVPPTQNLLAMAFHIQCEISRELYSLKNTFF